MENTYVVPKYNKSTGAGTLTGAARDLNVSLNDLIDANPEYKSNPNMVKAGAVLKIPVKVVNPSVQTSDMAINATNGAMDKLNSITSNQKTVVSKVTNADGSITTTYSDGTSSTTKPTVVDKKSSIADLITNNDPNKQVNPIDEKIAELDKGLLDTKSSIDSMLSSYTVDIDNETQGVIDDLKRIYSDRIAKQEEVNRALIGATNVSGFRSGRSRYASEIQDSILSAEETAGLKRINDLNNELTSLITQAKNAAATKKSEMTFKLMDKYDKAREERDRAVSEQYKLALDLEKLTLDRSQEQRQLAKDEIANMENMAENLVSGIVDLPEKELLSAINEISSSYGVDGNFLMTAVNKVKQDRLKDLPTSVREWEYMKQNYGYKGTLFNYQQQKANASRIASTGGEVLSSEDAKRFNLPSSLVGKSERDVILDLSVGRVPDWFREFLKKTEPEKYPEFTEEGIKSVWEAFRNTEDINVLKNTIDINGDGSDDGI